MKAKITIRECTDHGLVERVICGRWWWMTYVPDHGIRTGFARTGQRAQAKAEKAARELAAKPAENTTEYTYPLGQPTDRRERP